MNEKKTIRVRVKTNKFLDMIVAIEPDKTVRELAHRVLHCFHELAEQHIALPPKRRDLTVSALKVGNYHISKSELIGNMISDYDEIQCTLSKAKPKFPNCPKAYQIPSNKNITPSQQRIDTQTQHKSDEQSKKILQVKDPRKIDKKKVKREKKRQKMMEQLQKEMKKTNFKMNQLQEQQLDDDAYIIYRPKIEKSPEFRNPEFENSHINNQKHSNNKPNNLQSQQQQVVEIKPAIQESLPVNAQNELPLDTTLCLITQEPKQAHNASTETKKDQMIRPEEPRKKKPNAGSILQILSRTAQEKEKKAKKKQKKYDKSQQTGAQIKMTSVSTQANSNQSQKLNKNQKECSGNKIASPKVTFHNSPMLSPQVININSPKRKISNPNIEKIELENIFEASGTRVGKKEGEKEKKMVQKQQEEAKKETLTAAPSKIIVEEDSEQSAHITKLGEEQKQPEQVNSKLAALDARISKYKLEFFDGSDEDE